MDIKLQNDEEIQIFMHNVTWLRKQNGLSQKEMAVWLGVGVGTIRKIERGVLPPRLVADVVWGIQDSFQIPPRELFGGRLGE